MLRFSRKAKLAQKVLRMDPTMVSLPLDARRTKRPWSFDRFACLTCSFAPARRSSRETHRWHRQRQKNTFARLSNVLPLEARRSECASDMMKHVFYAMPARPNALPMC